MRIQFRIHLILFQFNSILFQLYSIPFNSIPIIFQFHPIQFYPILPNPIQFNPILPNPIQFYPIQFQPLHCPIFQYQAPLNPRHRLPLLRWFLVKRSSVNGPSTRSHALPLPFAVACSVSRSGAHFTCAHVSPLFFVVVLVVLDPSIRSYRFFSPPPISRTLPVKTNIYHPSILRIIPAHRKTKKTTSNSSQSGYPPCNCHDPFPMTSHLIN